MTPSPKSAGTVLALTAALLLGAPPTPAQPVPDDTPCIPIVNLFDIDNVGWSKDPASIRSQGAYFLQTSPLSDLLGIMADRPVGTPVDLSPHFTGPTARWRLAPTSPVIDDPDGFYLPPDEAFYGFRPPPGSPYALILAFGVDVGENALAWPAALIPLSDGTRAISIEPPADGPECTLSVDEIPRFIRDSLHDHFPGGAGPP